MGKQRPECAPSATARPGRDAAAVESGNPVGRPLTTAVEAPGSAAERLPRPKASRADRGGKTSANYERQAQAGAMLRLSRVMRNR